MRTLPLHAGDRTAAEALRSAAIPLTGAPTDYDELLAEIGDARIVLLGEASHGTHEFCTQRARITRRLICEHDFTAVCVEGDFPDAYRVHRHVNGRGQDRDVEEALRGFRRFPAWMWRNAPMLEFVGWLRGHNHHHHHARAGRTGFYGLDLYSLNASMEAVVAYLDVVDPAAARRARRRYECLQPFGADSADYGRAVLLGLAEPYRREVFAQLVELRRRAGDGLHADGVLAEDQRFVAECSATVVAGAEEYYRTLLGDRTSAWNLRDRHMADTLDALMAHLDRRDGASRVVVWAHNAHVGDARATEMHRRGELNLGQLLRERHGDAVRIVGFTTYAGTVTAARDWGGEAERRRVRPALPGTHEALLHEAAAAGAGDFLVCPVTRGAGARALTPARGERAIGVVYRPETERQSHWFSASITRQFDALVHLDETHAVEPLERTQTWDLAEPPETYPTAL